MSILIMSTIMEIVEASIIMAIGRGIEGYDTGTKFMQKCQRLVAQKGAYRS